MDILTLGVGLELGRVLGLELGHQDVPGLKNTGVNFVASGCRGPTILRLVKTGPKRGYQFFKSSHVVTAKHTTWKPQLKVEYFRQIVMRTKACDWKFLAL